MEDDIYIYMYEREDLLIILEEGIYIYVWKKGFSYMFGRGDLHFT